jgi:predicted nucleic acid-binding protein
MHNACLYDTRFFVEYFYSDDPEFVGKLKRELKSVKKRMVCALTVHEIHRINLKREGKDVAALRSNTIHGDFEVIDVDYKIAVKSAELRSMHQMPMADSVIAATRRFMNVLCSQTMLILERCKTLKQNGAKNNNN